MKITIYDNQDVHSSSFLREIESDIIPNKGDRINIQLENGLQYTGSVLERTFFIAEDGLYIVHVKCLEDERF